MKREEIDKNDYRSAVLITYSIKHLEKKDKIRFYYALKGRDGKTGIIKQYDIEQLGRAVLLVKEKHAKQVEDFLELWKCEYKIKEVLVK